MPAVRESSWSYILRVITLALAYYLLARLGLTFATVQGNVTLFWPPGGLAVAGLLLGGLRYWPGVTLGAILAHLSTHASISFIAITAVGNTLFPFIAVWLLKRNARFDFAMHSVVDAVRLVINGSLMAPLISAGCGTLALIVTGMALPERALGSVLIWWLGDGMGVLLMVPLILAWAVPSQVSSARSSLLNAVLLGGLTALLLVIVFGAVVPVLNEYFSLAFLLVPLIVWAAVCFGLRGAMSLTAIIAIVTVWSTAQGYGALALLPRSLDIEISWLFVVVCAATALFSGTAMEEHARSLSEQTRLVARLELALQEVQTLKGLLPICAQCKKIRDDKGYWQHVESYIARHSQAQFTHSLCPDCASKLYPDLQLETILDENT